MSNTFSLFMRACILVIGLLFFSSCQQSSDPERPNLVLIIADDMAWDDVGAYGHPHIRTPYLDRLAAEGMRFDRAFLTTSSCSPSRSSIITGRYPHNTGAEQLHWPLPGDQLTFVELLKESGYWTAQAGKWHLGEAVKDRFDVVKDGLTIGFDEDAEALQETERDGSGAEDWVSLLEERPEGQPFFLWLAAVDPHRVYEEGAISNPHTPEDVVVPPYLPDTEPVRKDLALYYDEITRMDDYIGKVMDKLDEQGVAENTLVLFISDNGRPFPRDKTTLLDGGIKTPWIVRWPAGIAANSVSGSLVSSIDIAPTFLSLAGLPVTDEFEGMDISSVFSNPNDMVRDAIYAEDHWHDHDDFSRAVRTIEYKYIRNFFPQFPNTPPADALTSPTFASILALREIGGLNEIQSSIFVTPRPEEELYAVQEDPFELVNLAADAAYSDQLELMRQRMQGFREATGDKDPEFYTPDEFDRITGEPNELMIRPRLSREEMKETYPID
ncbi:MAG: sulfatase [Rhodothermaceae bacterium]|nr:sulfatase [Rhodothermaceae bacterium]